MSNVHGSGLVAGLVVALFDANVLKALYTLSSLVVFNNLKNIKRHTYYGQHGNTSY